MASVDESIGFFVADIWTVAEPPSLDIKYGHQSCMLIFICE